MCFRKVKGPVTACFCLHGRPERTPLGFQFRVNQQSNIPGRTSVNQLIGRICEPVKPGSAGNVVPGRQNGDLKLKIF